MSRVFLSLGTNLGDRRMNLRRAVDAIRLLDSTRVEAVSAAIETKPQGQWDGAPVADFLNCCVRVETALEPFALLCALKEIESAMGRSGLPKVDAVGRRIYSDRIIDIDILLYDDLVIDTPLLQIPHPRMHEREFVLTPLREIL